MDSQYQKSQRVQIFVHGKDYQYGDGSPYVDSYLQIIESDGRSLSRSRYQSKEYKQNTSPKYTETLILDYYFEKRQALTFRVFVNGEQFGTLKDVPLSHLFQGVKVKNRELLDRHGQCVGKLEIWCEKVDVKQAKRKLKGVVKIVGLESMFNCLPSTNKKVFFKIERTKQHKNEKNELTIYQSQSINEKQGNQWSIFQIYQNQLCQNNENLQFELKLFYQSTLQIQIGSVILTLSTLQAHKKYKIKMDNKVKADIMFTYIQRSKNQNFCDYLESGLQIKTAIAIDFTESNINYQSQQSKHYIGAGKSQYEEVMKNLLVVMLEYNSDKKTPVFGFGAAVKNPRYNTKGKISHRFPINMDEDNPYIQQQDKIFQAYRNVLPHLDFAGPTLFTPLLTWSINQSKKMKQNKSMDQYQVVFVMTDGQVCDKMQIQKLLATCSNLPLTFIVIGIGEQDFSIMHEIQPNQSIYKRNIFKFVQYNKYKRNLRELIDQVLGQIPKHVQEYYTIKYQEQNQSRVQLSLESDQNTISINSVVQKFNKIR